MTTTIKISQLPNIGNVAGNTLLPVVSNTGTLLTNKATVQQVGNFILSQAGNSFPQAAISTLAQTVTNAAQPNITSVGVLTNLTTSGNVVALNVNGGNLVTANYLHGTLTTANQPFVTELGNLVSLTVEGPTDLGPIGNLTIEGGNTGEVLTTDGAGNLSWATVSGNGSYSNSNVANYLPTYTGNISGDYANFTHDVNANVVGANFLYGDASNVTNVSYASNSNNANFAGEAFNVAAANVSGLGNIATINLSGSNSNVLYGNGVFAAIPAVTLSGDGGNLSNINGANVSGVVANAEFANSIAVESVNNNFSYHVVLTTGPGDTTLHNDSDDSFQYNPYDGILTVTRVDTQFLEVSDTVLTNLVPFDSLPLNLGNATNPWNDLYLSNSTIYLGNVALSVADSGLVSTSEVIEGGEGVGGIAYIEWTTANNLLVRTSNTSVFIATFESLKINDSFTLINGSNGNFAANTNVFVNGAISQDTPVSGFIDFTIPITPAAGANVYVYKFNLTRAPLTEFSQLSGNTITLGNATISANGNSIVVDSITVTNGNVGEIGNIASLNLDGNVSNLLTGNGTFVAIPTVPTVGNIASLNLDGSSSNVLYGNGVFAAVTGGGNTGNVTFSNVTVQGDNTALNLSAGANFTANLAYLQVRAGDLPSHIHFDTGNSQAYDLLLGNDDKYVQVSSTGNIIMSSYDGNTSYIMTLDNTGDLILAGGSSIIRSVANSSLDPVNPNVSTMVLIPDAGYTSQSLVLDPTAPGHIHLRAPGANIDEPYANIFLGGEDSSFEVGYYNGSAPNLYIHSGGNTWKFSNDGTTTFPTGNITSNTSLQLTTTFANVKTVEYQTAGVWDLYVEDSITGSNTAASRLNVSFKDNLIDKPQVYIENTKESDGIALRWTFDENGNLNFPRDVAGNTDPFLTISGGANPRILSEDVSLAGPANLEITALTTIFTGSSGDEIRIYPDDGEIGSTGNLELWANAGSNVAQYNWTFDTTGNFSVPGNILVSGAASPAPYISGFSSISLNGTGTVVNASSGNILTNEVTGTKFNFLNGLYTATITGSGATSNYSLNLPANAGSNGQVLSTDGTGNLSWVSAGGGSYGDSNVVTLLSSFGSNTISTTGNISGGNLLASANVLSNGYARFSGSFDESQASTAGLYVGYAGNTSRIMFGTGNTLQTFEIDNDGGNLRFYKPGSTKATLTSAGDFSVSGNITANNLSNLVQWTTAPVANTSAGSAGQAAYDTGGNLYVCVSTNTWAKFTGTNSW